MRLEGLSLITHNINGTTTVILSKITSNEGSTLPIKGGSLDFAVEAVAFRAERET